jgi:hypothetical protein
MVQYFKVQEQRFVPAMAPNEAFWIHLIILMMKKS